MKAKKVGALLLAAAMAVCTVPVHGMAAEEGTKTPKYIFLFIGDGMSYPQVQTTNYYLNAIADDGDEILNSESKLNMMKFPVAGSAQTYDSTSFCPDSASTATSISTGHKTYSGTINMDEKMETSYETIAEKLKRQLGYKVGILSSVNLNHATPAAFYAHQAQRSSYYNVGLDLIKANYDFYAGSDFLDPTNKKGGDGSLESLYTLVDKAGYSVARGYKDYQKKAKKSDKMILLQPSSATDVSAIPYAIDRKKGDMTLAEITRAGINFLSKDLSKGFFLMVEGGKIDWACHSNDAATAFNEVVDLDDAIKVAYEFYEQHPDETLIVVTADHETGGIVLGKGPYTLNLQALKSQKVSESDYTRIINNLRKKYKNQVSWEVIKQSLKDNFGFWDSIQLNEKQEARLKKVYDESFGGQKVDLQKSEYQQDEPLASEAKKILNDIALVGWTSGGHSGGYVPVFAIGAGAELFQGRIDNTEIPVKIAEAAGYPN